MDFRGKKYERGSNWSDPEVVELLHLWADESVQAELESCLRNQHVFNRIAEVLRDKGIHRTGDQCREKIKKMKLEYRRIKDNNKAPRGGRTWKFYDVMDRVLASRPSLAYSASSNSSLTAQQVLQGSMVENYHHHVVPSGMPFAHSQPPELMEIKCEEVDSEEHCLTPEPPSSLTYQQVGPAEEPEIERAFLDRSQNDSPISRVEIPVETSVSPSGRTFLSHGPTSPLPFRKVPPGMDVFFLAKIPVGCSPRMPALEVPGPPCELAASPCAHPVQLGRWNIDTAVPGFALAAQAQCGW